MNLKGFAWNVAECFGPEWDPSGDHKHPVGENCAQARTQVSNLTLCVFLGDLNREAPTLSREAPSLNREAPTPKSLAGKCAQTRAPVSKLHCLENVKMLITSFARKHPL